MALPTLGAATPLCVSGTLDDYIALGSDGCTVGTLVVSGFSSAASLFGGSEIAATDIMVTPTVAGPGSQLAFGITAAPLGPASILGILIGYAVTGGMVGRADLELSGASATLDGAVTAVEDLCLGASFAPGPSCPTVQETLIAAQLGEIAQLSDTQILPRQSFFDVFVDITVDNGPTGTAALDGAVVTRFARVPEPASILLFSLGLAGVWAQRRRRIRS
jgi:hypothetical protein